MALSSSASVLISRAGAARRVVVGSAGWEYGDDGYGQNAPPAPVQKVSIFVQTSKYMGGAWIMSILM